MARILILFSGLFLFMGTTAHSAVDAKYINFSKLKLNDYLKKSGNNIEIEGADTQGDGKDNVFFVFEIQKSGDGKKQLKSHLFDLNGDGKIDLAKHFNLGKLQRSEADLDFDGKADVVTEFDPTTGDVLKKTENDGRSNIWRYWHKGEMRLKEMDRNSDKRPDIWIHYRSGQVIKTEVDVDFDGKNIRVQSN